jgi:hypothetical protein
LGVAWDVSGDTAALHQVAAARSGSAHYEGWHRTNTYANAQTGQHFSFDPTRLVAAFVQTMLRNIVLITTLVDGPALRGVRL